jgi:hypothetical protein
MYCENCGSPIADGAKFCRTCGAPVGGDDAEELTRVMNRKKGTGAHVAGSNDLTQTRVMPRSTRQQTRQSAPVDPVDPAPQYGDRGVYDDGPTGRSPLPIILLAIAVALAVAFAVFNCTKRPTSPTAKKDEAAATNTAKKDDAAQQSEKDDSNTGGDAPVDPTETRAGGPEEPSAADDANQQSVDQATLDQWAATASSFMRIYPVNHIEAGGAGDEPSQLSVEDWASSLMNYVDPSSSLGQSLQNDPSSVADALGFYQVASVVRDTQVTGQSTGGINIQVTLEATQMDWQNTDSFVQEYLVQFNSNGQITDVIPVG